MEKAEMLAKVALSQNARSSESLASLRAPTIGGSDERTNNDLRTMQEAVSPYGTVLPSKKFVTSCLLPGSCQS